MANLGAFRIELVIANAKAVRALAVAAWTLGEYADRYPFDADLARAVRAMRYAARRLTARSGPPPEV